MNYSSLENTTITEVNQQINNNQGNRWNTEYVTNLFTPSD